MDPASGAADVQRLARVLLEMHPLDTDAVCRPRNVDVEITLDAQRLVVLRDLVVLRHVRIEVVLAREAAPRRDRALQRKADLHGELDGPGVGDGKAAGQSETDRADLGVGCAAEHRRASAEQLRRRAQLDVRLQTECRVVAFEHLVVSRHASTGACSSTRSVPSAASTAAATRYIRSSACTGAMIWKPTGKPSSGDRPQGTDIAGPP